MNWDQLLRAVGVIGVLGLYFIYTMYGGALNPLLVMLTALFMLVAPEMVDQMPWGPSK